MKLLLLGTSGYHPSDQRHTACLMLPEIGVVLDAGTAMYRVRDHLQTDTLDIFITHGHLDHIIGLTFLFDVTHGREMRRVTVHAQENVLAAIEEHLFAPAVFPVRPPFETQPLSGEAPLPNGGRLRGFPLEHPGGSQGYRLDWPNHSMAYVSDTTARLSSPYLAHIRNVDLLIHECYFNDDQPELAELTGHSCVTPVAEVAREVGAKQLLLTHVNPLADPENPIDLAAARKVFPATRLGMDGMSVEF